MSVVDKQTKSHRLTNFMEELTDNVLEGLLTEYKGSRFSTDAIQDIKALALNRLWPMYTTSDSGKNFLKKIIQEDKIEKDVARELRAAIDIVKSNPRK
jgi:hypothetical protein